MEYNIKLTENELELIYRCLAEQPYKLVVQTIDKIKLDVQEQTIRKDPETEELDS